MVIALIAVLFGLAIVATTVLIRRGQPPLTRYQGKSLADWAAEYYRGADAASRANAAAAFHDMGTVALPELRRLLVTGDPLWRRTVWNPKARLPMPLRRLLTRQLAEPVAFKTREAAAAAIGLYGAAAESAVPELIASLAEPSENRICIEAATALGQVGKAAMPAVLTAAQSADWRVRYWAAYALGQMGAEAQPAIPQLVILLHDGQVSQMAASALWKIGPPAVPALVDCLKETSPLVLEKAMLSLGEIGSASQAAVPALRRWEQDESTTPAVRSAAKQAIAKILP